MEGFKFEFFKQVAIFTLKNDLKATSEQIEAFTAAYIDNVETIGNQMIRVAQSAKDPDYIQKQPTTPANSDHIHSER